jgi:DivIVA domain-containing protein
MDRQDIEGLPDPGFTTARRGYDQREVDKFLEALAARSDNTTGKARDVQPEASKGDGPRKACAKSWARGWQPARGS